MSKQKKLIEDERIVDRNNYAELCKGYESVEAANDAVSAFWKEFYELRNKYKLQDVHVIVLLNVQDAGEQMLSMHAGSDLTEEAMCAWALGQASADRQKRTMRFLSMAKSIDKQDSRQ